MLCEYCLQDMPKVYRVLHPERDEDVWLCVECRHDLLYCEMKGQIAQNPEDQ